MRRLPRWVVLVVSLVAAGCLPPVQGVPPEDDDLTTPTPGTDVTPTPIDDTPSGTGTPEPSLSPPPGDDDTPPETPTPSGEITPPASPTPAPTEEPGSTESPLDQDGDGSAPPEDCDDRDPAIGPTAAEKCDGKDNDCDGRIDEDLATTVWYRDSDGDGYGATVDTKASCQKIDGYSALAGDCNDSDAATRPGAPELCDSFDNNCNGRVDEDVVFQTYNRDSDNDGYGTSAVTTVTCAAAPSGFTAKDGDCNDADAKTYPGAPEACDGKDNDCDGKAESAPSPWYADSDHDGYGDPTDKKSDCTQPPGRVANGQDCDDDDPYTYPGATELCDSRDNNCDGRPDTGGSTWYADEDGDGFGDRDSSLIACVEPEGHVEDGRDCDDRNPAIYPGATEICDGKDNDCDQQTDESGGSTWYADADGDGYGSASSAQVSCAKPPGYVSNASDCEDDDATVYPNATEVCDGQDNDCDHQVDEAGASTWYRDGDGDGYGTASSTTVSCVKPTGYAANGNDCDDGDPTMHPEAAEVCDEQDNDCDQQTDEAGGSTWYVDSDADGSGSDANTRTACTRPTGYVASADDCDDADPASHPGAAEVCDTKDNDCDGQTDEVGALWYEDADEDGYGDASSSRNTCTQPDGHVADATDCNDADEAINPGADEVTCNGADENCNGGADDHPDDDDDGYDLCEPDVPGSDDKPADCDDEDPEAYPDEEGECD